MYAPPILFLLLSCSLVTDKSNDRIDSLPTNVHFSLMLLEPRFVPVCILLHKFNKGQLLKTLAIQNKIMLVCV